MLLFAVWTACKLYNRHTEECASKIPGPRGYPIIGNMLLLSNLNTLDSILPLSKSISVKFEKYGIFKLWIGPLLHVTVYEPKYIEAIARSPNSAYKGPLLNILFGDVFEGFPFTDDVSKWKELRKPFMKLLTTNLLEKNQYRIFINKAKDLVDHLREKRLGKEINVIDDLGLYSFEMFLETHFGVASNELRNPRFYYLKYLNRFLDYPIPNALMIYLLKKIKLKSKLPEVIAKSNAKFAECIEWVFQERKKRGKSEVGFEYYPDFLLRRQQEKGLPANKIHTELADLVVAGSDTIAVTTSSAIAFLAMHPDVHELAYKEQEAIFGTDRSRDPTYEELSSMEYLTRVVKETLRIVCPPITYKYTRGDVDIGDYIIPKGTEIEIFVEQLHRDPKHWEQPLSFYPDHFLPEKEDARHKYSYIPYGIGPRACPGSPYAMVAIKTTLSFILRNFNITKNLKFEDITYKFKLMKIFNCGYMVTLSERSKHT